MSAITSPQNFVYTGTNIYMDSLIWSGQWVTTGSGPTIVHYNLQSGADPFNFNGLSRGLTWTAAEEAAIRAAFDAWSAVANIQFVEVSNPNDADVWYWKGTEAEIGALGWHEVPDAGAAEPLYGVFSSTSTGWTNTGLMPGGYGFVTLLHEIGHGLGLAHPHDNGGGSAIFPGVSSAFDDYGDFDLNQGIFTLMTYNDGWATQYPTFFDANYGWTGTPMTFDIAAIQEIYGANMDYNTGDDVYMLPDTNGSGTYWSAIWDAGGTDAISAEGSTRDFVIDLRDAPLTGANAGGYVSFFDGIVGGFTIAANAVIENAIGGEGDDQLTGNESDNQLTGNGGSDSLNGGMGHDTLNGGAGQDFFDGGDGMDFVDYTDAAGRVLVDLFTDASGAGYARFYDEGASEGETYTDIEGATGGRFSDQLRGDQGDNEFHGGNGFDRIYGRRGDDTLEGGNGGDVLYGNNGADVMTGGLTAQRDRFVYFSASDTGVGAGNRDIITDFQTGLDRIEISRIDADLGRNGKQKFDFIGDTAFSGTAGELRYEQSGGITVVQADQDGDGNADFEIELTGTITLVEGDFLI